MQTKLVTEKELIERLEKRGSTWISLFIQRRAKDSDMAKKTNPYWDKANKRWLITKFQWVVGGVNTTHINWVNNARKKFGLAPREAKPRRWGQRISPLIVTHKHCNYITVITAKNKYMSIKTEWRDDAGNIVDVSQWRKKKTTKKEEPIIYMDIPLHTVKVVKFDKTAFHLANTQEVPKEFKVVSFEDIFAQAYTKEYFNA